MEFVTHNINEEKIAEIVDEGIVVNTLQDALDLLGDVSYNLINKIIIHDKNLAPAFFKLSSGLAGEVLQKCVNYHIKLAIVGNFEKYTSNSLRAFIIECNRGRQFFFVDSVEKAKEMLNKNL